MNRAIYRLMSGRIGAGIEIRILTRETAKVFGAEAPKDAKLLRRYARFTAEEAANAIRSGQDLKVLRKELYCMARRLGSGLRRRMRPRNERECLAIVTMLYRNIGITIRETEPGKIRVSKCYFSSFYTPEVCYVISAIDQGIFAGIYGGGRLRFIERITEGHEACVAELRRER